jgi:ApaG protein
MYKKITKDIEVSVEPAYLSEQSNPLDNHYVWSYSVNIRNNGTDSIQLKERHWKIMDAQGNIQEVQGKGVIGKQPIINPGEQYNYISGTPLTTPSGFMSGTYSMENTGQGNSDSFDVEIPAFSLDSPFGGNTVN